MSTSAQITFEKKATALPLGSLMTAGVLALMGWAAWGYQLAQGMRVISINQQVAWGLYIVAFFAAAGAGAGLLVLTGISEFKPLLSFEMKLRVLSLALVSFIVAGLLITMDVGSPFNLWRLVSFAHLNAMMVLDFWLLCITVLVTVYYLFQVRKTSYSQPFKALGILAVVLAVAVISVESWMLSTQAAHPMWGTGSILLSFLVGATIAGLGAAVLIMPKASFARPALICMLVLNLIMVLSEVLTGFLGGNPIRHEEMGLVLTVPLSLFFWFQMIFGLAIPLLLLLKNSALRLTGILAIAGVLAEKLWLIAAGQAKPWMPEPVSLYLPSWIEFAAVIGMIASGVFLYKLIRLGETCFAGKMR